MSDENGMYPLPGKGPAEEESQFELGLRSLAEAILPPPELVEGLRAEIKAGLVNSPQVTSRARARKRRSRFGLDSISLTGWAAVALVVFFGGWLTLRLGLIPSSLIPTGFQITDTSSAAAVPILEALPDPLTRRLSRGEVSSLATELVL